MNGGISFAVMATIWGLTWIAIKTGVTAVPPFFFAATRIVAAGLILQLLAYRRGVFRSPLKAPLRLIVAALLVNTAGYGLLFWGMQSVASGISAVVNLALIPVGLFSLGLLLHEETFSWQRVLALLMGVIGLTLLFFPKLRLAEEMPVVTGMVALVGGTLSYCLGSILSRPLFKSYAPLSLSALHNLIGGLGLVLLSLVSEPIGGAEVRAFFSLPVLGSWLFLVLAGSVVAYTLYLGLLRDWGPSRAGLYAFVSPVVAVASGFLVFGERLSWFELGGAAILLSAAGLAILPARIGSEA